MTLPLKQQIFQMLVEFGATFTGVVLAFGLSLWYDRQKRHKKEIKTKIRILETIKEELDLHLDPLIRTPVEFEGARIIPFITNALDSSVGGGYFSLLEPETQKRISKNYGSIKLAEIYNNKIISMTGATGIDRVSRASFEKSLEKTLIRLAEHTPELIKFLERKITEYNDKLDS